MLYRRKKVVQFKNDMMANNVRMLVFDLSITVMSELLVYSVKQMLLPVQAF